eukprot:g6074.t1
MERIRERALDSMRRDIDREDSQLDDRIESFGSMMRDAMIQLSNEIDAVTSANKRRRSELRRLSSQALRNFAKRVDKQIEVHRRLDQLERYVAKYISDREALEASKALFSLGSRVSSLQERLIDYFKKNKQVSTTKTSTNQPSPRRRAKQLDIDGKIQSLERRLDRVQRQVMDSNEQTLEILNSALAFRQKKKK